MHLRLLKTIIMITLISHYFSEKIKFKKIFNPPNIYPKALPTFSNTKPWLASWKLLHFPNKCHHYHDWKSSSLSLTTLLSTSLLWWWRWWEWWPINYLSTSILFHKISVLNLPVFSYKLSVHWQLSTDR